MTFTGVLMPGLDPVLERPAWLDWRRTHVGGSDVPAVLGLSGWASPYSRWAEKVGLLGEEPDDELMEAGRWLEHGITPWFAHRTGLHVIGAQGVVEAADDPIASCTVDGFVAESSASEIEDALGLLEIKTRNFGRRWEQIPADIQAQCQWQMYVTGLDHTWIAVLMGRRLDIHELERDDSDILFMVDRVHRWWTDHVVTGTPPPADGSDATLRALAEVYPHATPDKTVELDGLADVLAEWAEAKQQRTDAEKREKECKALIQAALEDAEEGTVGGERVVTFREQTRESYVVKESTFRVLRSVSARKKEPVA